MSGRTIKVLTAALVVAVALAGCGGGPLKMGAAAIVDDDRIAVSTLDRVVLDWRQEFRADPLARRARANSGPRPDSDLRTALDLLVFIRIGNEVARRDDITVRPGQVERIIGILDARGGAASFARSQGLPGRYARDLVRVSVVQNMVAQRFGAGSGDGTAAPAGSPTRERFARAARAMDIRINPRYGTFDPATVNIDPVQYTLSATERGTADP